MDPSASPAPGEEEGGELGGRASAWRVLCRKARRGQREPSASGACEVPGCQKRACLSAFLLGPTTGGSSPGVTFPWWRAGRRVCVVVVLMCQLEVPRVETLTELSMSAIFFSWEVVVLIPSFRTASLRAALLLFTSDFVEDGLGRFFFFKPKVQECKRNTD